MVLDRFEGLQMAISESYRPEDWVRCISDCDKSVKLAYELYKEVVMSVRKTSWLGYPEGVGKILWGMDKISNDIMQSDGKDLEAINKYITNSRKAIRAFKGEVEEIMEMHTFLPEGLKSLDSLEALATERELVEESKKDLASLISNTLAKIGALRDLNYSSQNKVWETCQDIWRFLNECWEKYKSITSDAGMPLYEYAMMNAQLEGQIRVSESIPRKDFQRFCDNGIGILQWMLERVQAKPKGLKEMNSFDTNISKKERFPSDVMEKLKENYSDSEIASMSEEEVFDGLLKYEGIIGYSSKILRYYNIAFKGGE